jgi:hypothetical protein
MRTYISALCWAGAILGVAVAGAFGMIDEASTQTLLIALPAVAWTVLTGRTCRLTRRGAGA